MTTQPTAGYSEKTLVQKLGYKPGERVQLINAPDWFKDHLQTEAIELVPDSPTWLHGFFTAHDQLATLLRFIREDVVEKGIWVSWPKKSSGIKTDVTEQTFRDEILPLGWVDVKVAAIDDTWSGLLFYRRKN